MAVAGRPRAERGKGRRSAPAGRSRAHSPLDWSRVSRGDVVLGGCSTSARRQRKGRKPKERTDLRTDYLWTTVGRSERWLHSRFGGDRRDPAFVVAAANISVCSFSNLFSAFNLELPFRSSGEFELRVCHCERHFCRRGAGIRRRLSLFPSTEPSEMDITLLLMTLAAEQCGSFPASAEEGPSALSFFLFSSSGTQLRS